MDQFQSFESSKESENNPTKLDYKASKNEKISNSSRRAWSQEQDNQLKYAIKLHGHNWLKVASALQNRNPSQCAQRWKRIKPLDCKKRKTWNDQEDQLLLRLVEIHKDNWFKIAKQIPNRTSKQVRERFRNKLNPEINKEPFTEAEDKLIIEGYKCYGTQWCKISKTLSGRPENLIKNRFYSYLRKHYLQIDNPYYVIPQPTQRRLNSFQIEKEEEQDKIITLFQEPKIQKKFKDQVYPPEMKKQKKSKFQEFGQIQVVKEEQSDFENKVKEEPLDASYHVKTQIIKEEENFQKNLIAINNLSKQNCEYFCCPQIGLVYETLCFLLFSILQYGVANQETFLLSSQHK